MRANAMRHILRDSGILALIVLCILYAMAVIARTKVSDK